jgi:hypothetical protein
MTLLPNRMNVSTSSPENFEPSRRRRSVDRLRR